MIYRNEDNTIVLQFGTGDIEVGNGRVASDTGKEMYPCCVFIQQEGPNEIGTLVNPDAQNEPAEPRPDSCISFVFTDIRSIDVVIESLKETKERFKKNGFKVLSMQEITDEV